MVFKDDEEKHLIEGEETDGAAQDSQESFAALLEESLTGFKEGEVVTGRVVDVTPVSVIVDIGYKAEGEIPLEEFSEGARRQTVEVGDEFEVMIEAKVEEGEEETIILSRRRVGEAQAWERIEQAFQQESPLAGTIIGRVRGGLKVDIGVHAFLPGSQVDLRPVKDLESVVGQTFEFKILKYSRRRRNVVLSRRAILEEERADLKEKLLAELKDGQVLTGVVKNVVKYGAFIDLGGMDGLLHVSDMSWGRIQHPGDLVKVGQELSVKVLKFDRERERISLGLKQLTPDPWSTAEEKYPPGTKVVGRVVNVVDYGAFIELESGLEGLTHVTEMSWSGNVRQANKILEEGQEVEAVVMSLDPENRKLALSLKRCDPDPWEDVAERYPPGTIIEGKIKTVTEFGVFIGLEDGIDGLVHKKDLSWSGGGASPEESYQTGEVIQAMVLAVDPEKKRVALGVRQLSPDPWPELTEDLSIGKLVSGKVTGQAEFGTFVEVAEGLEGLIPADEEGGQPDLAVGQEIQVRVLEMQPERHRLSLALVED